MGRKHDEESGIQGHLVWVAAEGEAVDVGAHADRWRLMAARGLVGDGVDGVGGRR